MTEVKDAPVLPYSQNTVNVISLENKHISQKYHVIS